MLQSESRCWNKIGSGTWSQALKRVEQNLQLRHYDSILKFAVFSLFLFTYLFLYFYYCFFWWESVQKKIFNNLLKQILFYLLICRENESEIPNMSMGNQWILYELRPFVNRQILANYFQSWNKRIFLIYYNYTQGEWFLVALSKLYSSNYLYRCYEYRN